MTAAARTRCVALLVAATAFAVYLTNLRPMGSGDTIAARLQAFSLVREGNLDLDEFTWLRPRADVRPYFLLRDGSGRWRSKYPVATPVVAAPLAWPFERWAAARGIEDRDARFRLLTVVFERVASALLVAPSVALVLLAAAEIAPLGWAVAASLVYAFGTSTWTYSQALWQHALAELGIAGAALCLLRSPSPHRFALAGTAMALALAARPTTVIIAVILALYLWRERRAALWWFAPPYALGALLLAAYNARTLARATGGYAGGGIGFPAVEGLLGLLVSPNRGLFVYCPLALLALVALARPTQPRVARWFALALPAYALLFATSRIWWGGFSWGPRFFTDVMPLITLAALPVAGALWTAHRGARLLLIAGAAWGIAVQAIGVYCDDNDWNTFPVSVDEQTERLWSWSDPQILRALRTGWRGGEFGPLLWQLLTDPRPAPLAVLAPGDLAGSIESPHPGPWHCRAGAWCSVEVRITNRSAAAVWPTYSDFGDLEVGVGAFWRDGDAVVPDVGGFIPIRRQLGPGDAAPFRLAIDAPARSGTYDLELRVMQSFGRTGQHGDAALSIPVVVE